MITLKETNGVGNIKISVVIFVENYRGMHQFFFFLVLICHDKYRFIQTTIMRMYSVLGTVLVIWKPKTNVYTPFLRGLLLPPSPSHEIETCTTRPVRLCR